MKKLINIVTSVIFISFNFYGSNSSFSNEIESEQTLTNVLDIESEKLSTNKLDLDNYLLGPGDTLKVNLEAYPKDKSSGTILNDGTFNVPFIGAIKINNLSIEEAEEKIENELSKQLIRPEINLLLINTRPISLLLIGDVNTPGYYVTKKNNATLIDALQLAGGLTPESNLENIMVQRKLSGTNKKYKQKKFNLINLLKNGDITQNPYLFDGDIIKVEKADRSKPVFREVANSNLTGKISVNIIGEIAKPGRISISPNTPLNQAIFYAGGPKGWRSQKGYVKILRINPNSTISTLNIRANLGRDTVDPKNPLLKKGDTIIVRKTPLASSYDTLRLVTKPLGDILAIDRFLREID